MNTTNHTQDHASPNTDAGELLTIKEAARLVRTHIATIYRWILSGRLPARKLVGQHRIRRTDLEALLVPVEPRRPTPAGAEQRERVTRQEQDRWAREVLRKAGYKLGAG